MRTHPGVCAAVLALVCAGPALADKVHFKAHLTGRSESPPNATTGKGDVSADYDTDTHVLTYKVTYRGLTGPATMAHFHGPAKPGQNAPAIIQVSDPSSPISGHVAITDAQERQLENGLWYFNIHTQANPGGEIRGQLERQVDWSQAEAPTGEGQNLGDLPRAPSQIGDR